MSRRALRKFYSILFYWSIISNWILIGYFEIEISLEDSFVCLLPLIIGIVSTLIVRTFNHAICWVLWFVVNVVNFCVPFHWITLYKTARGCTMDLQKIWHSHTTILQEMASDYYWPKTGQKWAYLYVCLTITTFSVIIPLTTFLRRFFPRTVFSTMVTHVDQLMQYICMVFAMWCAMWIFGMHMPVKNPQTDFNTIHLEALSVFVFWLLTFFYHNCVSLWQEKFARFYYYLQNFCLVELAIMIQIDLWNDTWFTGCWHITALFMILATDPTFHYSLDSFNVKKKRLYDLRISTRHTDPKIGPFSEFVWNLNNENFACVSCETIAISKDDMLANPSNTIGSLYKYTFYTCSRSRWPACILVLVVRKVRENGDRNYKMLPSLWNVSEDSVTLSWIIQILGYWPNCWIDVDSAICHFNFHELLIDIKVPIPDNLKDYRSCSYCNKREHKKRRNRKGKRIADFKVCRQCKRSKMHLLWRENPCYYCSMDCMKKDWPRHRFKHNSRGGQQFDCLTLL